MKSALALLALTTAITTSVIGALSATPMSVPGGTSLSTAEPSGSVLLLADNDEKGGWRLLFGDDDDHHAGHDSDDDEEQLRPRPAGLRTGCEPGACR